MNNESLSRKRLFFIEKIPTMAESGNASRPLYRGGSDIVGFIL